MSQHSRPPEKSTSMIHHPALDSDQPVLVPLLPMESNVGINAIKEEIMELRGLIFNLGKTVQSLAEKVDQQSQSHSASASSHSSVASDQEVAKYIEKPCQLHPPPIVKELHNELYEHNITVYQPGYSESCASSKGHPPPPIQL